MKKRLFSSSDNPVNTHKFPGNIDGCRHRFRVLPLFLDLSCDIQKLALMPNPDPDLPERREKDHFPFPHISSEVAGRTIDPVWFRINQAHGFFVSLVGQYKKGPVISPRQSTGIDFTPRCLLSISTRESEICLSFDRPSGLSRYLSAIGITRWDRNLSQTDELPGCNVRAPALRVPAGMPANPLIWDLQRHRQLLPLKPMPRRSSG
jgi:hypothetical protein